MNGCITDIVLDVSVKHREKIDLLTQPLALHFGVAHFLHFKISHNGYFSAITNHIDWMSYYFSEKQYLVQPHFRRPTNFHNGISLARAIESDDYHSMLRLGREKYNLHGCMLLLKKSRDGLEGIAFDMNSASARHESLLLNELATLRKYINHFAKETAYLAPHINENRIDMAALVGQRFESADIPVMAHLENKRLFLSDIGIELPTNLTAREKDILQLMLKGNTAKQSASDLHLSVRTVEGHIDNIKCKLHCHSKAELFQKAREYRSLGFFS
jgi:DNA-binding CsgD family transcriptional regulator